MRSLNPIKKCYISAGLTGLLLLAGLLADSGAMSHGQMMMTHGTVVRVLTGDLVFIDKGSDSSVAAGDIFDIVSEETLTAVVYPLSNWSAGSENAKNPYPPAFQRPDHDRPGFACADGLRQRRTG